MLPRPASRVDFCYRSDVGRVRARNEDTLAIREDRGWAVLADGMGGYRGGDVASRVAVETILEHLERELGDEKATAPEAVMPVLDAAVHAANAAIRREASNRLELWGMGSTVVSAVFLTTHVVCVHVGDSRLYRFDASGLERLTRDHTMLQDMVDAGIMSAASAARSQFRGLLTRGLGVSTQVVPEVAIHAAQAGDVFLLCSDGLTDMLDDNAIASLLGAEDALGGRLDACAERLVAEANARGGRDNISVILARMLA